MFCFPRFRVQNGFLGDTKQTINFKRPYIGNPLPLAISREPTPRLECHGASAVKAIKLIHVIYRADVILLK